MSNAAEIIQKDLDCLWHPFTQQKIWPSEPPLVISGGQGNWLVDIDGKRYFDGVSSLWVTVHGHGEPAINQAIKEQVEALDHSTMLGLTHPKAALLAAELARLTPPGLSRVFYSESGSTAVEIALKIAYQYWQLKGQSKKRTFVSLAEAYHGDTIGAVSIGGIELFHEVYRPLLFAKHTIAQPNKNKPGSAERSVADLARVLAEHAEEICALVIEPRVQGAAGMIIQPDGYFSTVCRMAHEAGVLVVADEVATGFGRTGAMFACQLEDVRPDLMALGKGLTGGVLPLAATMASEEIYGAFLGEFDEFRHFFHGHTYTGNPIACAAALANLALMQSRDILANVAARAAQLARGLAELARLDHVVDVRQQGMMCGVELAADKASGLAYAPGRRMGHQVTMAARRRGVIIRPLGDTVVLMPPLSSSEQEIAFLLEVVGQAIVEATEEGA